MAYVLDCSVAMAWVFADEATDETARLLDSLVDDRAYVPSLWPVEVAGVLLAATQRGRIGLEERSAIRANLEALPIEIDPVSPSRAWGAALDLARKHELSAYDAMYLELAVRLQVPLATLDRKLRTAGEAAGIGTPTIA